MAIEKRKDSKNKKTNINRNLFDQSVREQNIPEWNGFLEFLEIDKVVTGFKNNDHTTVETGEQRSDNVFKTIDNNYLNIENSYEKPRYGHIVKQVEYGVHIYGEKRRLDPQNSKWHHKENYTPVDSIYICAKPIDEHIIYVFIQTDSSIKVKVYTLSNINGDEYLNNLKKKIKNNEILNYCDVAFLKFSTLTQSKLKKHEMLIEAIKINNQDQTLSKEIKLKIEMIQEKVCEMYIDKKYQNEVKGAFKMKTMKQELIDDVTKRVTEDVTEKVTRDVTEDVTERVSGRIFEVAVQSGIDDATLEKMIDILNQEPDIIPFGK